MKKPMTREAMLNWFNEHAGQRIEITVKGTPLVLRGTTEGVETVDACSTELQECEINTGVGGVQVALVLHQHALGIHVLATREENAPLAVSVPISVPYASVILGLEGESRNPSKEDVVYTPYELLHPNSN
ncbi:MAG: hypothetical protein OEW39_07010 [Deltaproteobacteria bacterium]|nr:hypothetical protein [Deltaproteobacteria bacterium]